MPNEGFGVGGATKSSVVHVSAAERELASQVRTMEWPPAHGRLRSRQSALGPILAGWGVDSWKKW